MRVVPELQPAGYPSLLEAVKTEVRSSRLRAHRAVNTEMIGLYWRIRRMILGRQEREGWGQEFIPRLSADLRREFPGARGFSARNLRYMRALAAAWPEEDAIVQHAAAQLPWGHVMVLLDKVKDPAARDWYAAEAVRHGWSRDVIANQIMAGVLERAGGTPSNFPSTLRAEESEVAQQLTKDPYKLEFLGLTGEVAELELEDALMEQLQRFLLELGHGFSFVGRQYHFEVDGNDFWIDLLFFNFVQNRFVVVELKIGKFEPAFTGQLGFYVAWVDDNLRRKTDHASTVGILLCRDRDDAVVRYSLASSSQPMAVASYTYDALPEAERAALPTAEDLTAAIRPEPMSKERHG